MRRMTSASHHSVPSRPGRNSPCPAGVPEPPARPASPEPGPGTRPKRSATAESEKGPRVRAQRANSASTGAATGFKKATGNTLRRLDSKSVPVEGHVLTGDPCHPIGHAHPVGPFPVEEGSHQPLRVRRPCPRHQLVAVQIPNPSQQVVERLARLRPTLRVGPLKLRLHFLDDVRVKELAKLCLSHGARRSRVRSSDRAPARRSAAGESPSYR